MRKTTKYKLAMICLKYIPLCMFLSMWIHTILLTFGISLFFAETIMGCALFPCILILSLSGIFQYCYIHKVMTVYALVIDIFINYERYIGFGILLAPLKIMCSLIGLIIFILLLVRYDSFKNKCIKIKLNGFY